MVAHLETDMYVWRIEIQATDKTWFLDHILPVTSDPKKGDERISELRRQGFKARGRMEEKVDV